MLPSHPVSDPSRLAPTSEALLTDTSSLVVPLQRRSKSKASPGGLGCRACWEGGGQGRGRGHWRIFPGRGGSSPVNL
jgi:hypothetical protein